MDVFDNVFTRIDDTVITSLIGGTSNLLGVVLPAFQAVFIVYVMFIAFSYWQSSASIESSAIDLVKRIVVWGLILGFSMNVSQYNSVVVPFVLNLGDGLSQAFSGNPTSSASSLDSLANKIVDLISENAEKAYETPGISEKIGAVLNATFNNGVILIAASIFMVIAAAYFVLIKVFLALLVVIGPIFIGFLLFPATRQYGMNWINQILNYSLLALMINIAGTFFISYINGILAEMTASYATGSTAVLEGVIGTSGMVQIVLATLMFVIILWKLPELTSSLAGGMAAGGFSQLVNAARMGKQLAGKSGGGKSGGSASKGAAKTAEAKGK